MSEGTQLASGYVDLTVKYGDAQKQISRTFDGFVDGAEKAGQKAGDVMANGLGDGAKKGAKAAQQYIAQGDIAKTLAKELGSAGDKASKELLRSLAAGNEQAKRNATQAGKAYAAAMANGTKGAGGDAARKFEAEFRSALHAREASQVFFDEFHRDGVAMGERVGTAIGKTISAGIKIGAAGAAAAVAGIGYSLTKGFERLEKIDQARFKLKALGNSATDVNEIMQDATASVQGTAFALDEATSSAASAVAAGIKPGKQLTKYLTTIGDASAIAGTSFEDMASIFNKVTTSNKAYTDDLNQLADRSLPIFEWLQDQYHVSADALRKMVEDGKVDAQGFQDAIANHIGGAAQKMGQSFGGAMDNMHASIARLGANFISAVFGGPGVNPLATPTEAVGVLTDKLNEAGAWVQAHGKDIHDFFMSAKDAGKQFIDVVLPPLKVIGDVLKEHPGLITAVALAFAAFKTGELVKGTVDGLKTISSLLRLTLPADAAAGAAGVNSALAAIVAPAWLVAFLSGGSVAASNAFNNWSDDHPGVQRRDSDGKLVPGREGQNGGRSSAYSGNVFNGQGPQLGAQRERRGVPSIDPTGGLLNPGGVLGARGGPTVGGGQALPGAVNLPASGGGAESWRPLVRSTVAGYAAQYGITNPKAWEDALVRQINTESGGNAGSVNDHDSNGRGGTQRVAGILNFLESTFNGYNVSGGSYMDPAAQIAAAIPYVMKRWGVGSDGGPLQIGRGVGFATGGAAAGPGGPTADKIPAMLSNGEHVWTAAEVAAVGGQENMYRLRQMALAGMLPGFNTGGAVKNGVMVWPPEPVQPSDKTRPGGVPQVTPGGKGKNQIAIPDWSVPGTTFGPPPDDWWLKPINPDDILFPDMQEPGSPWKHPPSKRIKLLGYAEGGQVTLEDLLKLDQVDPNSTQHGQGQGQPLAPGPTPDQLQQFVDAQHGGDDGRTQGYIPAGAGNTGQAGGSFASGLLNMGSEAIGGVLDMAAQAASMAATVGSMGAGAAGGSQAAGAAISMGTQAAKRGVQYGFQMAGIGVDALAEILSPFGVPRFFQTDPTAFIPQLPGQKAAVTTGEKATLAQDDPAAAQQNPQYSPAGPVQPGQVNGAQPVGAPAAPAQGGGAAPGPVPMTAGAPMAANPAGPPPGPVMPRGNTPGPSAPGPMDPLLKNFGIFDRGGMLEPGAAAVNKSRRAEPMAVFTGDQWGTLKTLASQDAAKPVPGGGPDFSVNLHGDITVKDVKELEAQLNSKQRLQMMRYAGRP